MGRVGRWEDGQSLHCFKYGFLTASVKVVVLVAILVVVVGG